MTAITLKVITSLFLTITYFLQNTATASGEVKGCRYKNILWGSLDGTKFYFCLPGTDTPIEQPCPQNTFFIKNATVSGCLPLHMCQTECIYRSSESEPQPCIGNNLKQMQPSINPTDFYLCIEEGAEPVKLSCPEGMAFVKQDGYLGCFQWSDWRQIRNCSMPED